MHNISKRLVFLLVFFLTMNGAFHAVVADSDEHKEKHRYQKRERKHSEPSVKREAATANSPAYAENCGACHFAYQPGLLPSGSWDKILNSLANHFGESIALDPESKKKISEHLRSHAAEFSSSELAEKIMRSIGNQTPQRITEISYIQRKHREIQQNALKRESIGSLSNCSACHTNAEKGIYDDDDVTIPR